MQQSVPFQRMPALTSVQPVLPQCCVGYLFRPALRGHCKCKCWLAADVCLGHAGVRQVVRVAEVICGGKEVEAACGQNQSSVKAGCVP